MPVAATRTGVTIRKINGERFTPLSLAKKLGAKALLESASFQRGRERYSFLLVKEAFRVFQKGDSFYMSRDGTTLALKTRARDILDVTAHFSRQHDGAATPFPLPTGGVGYLSYEYCRRFDDIRLREKPDPLGHSRCALPVRERVPRLRSLFGHDLPRGSGLQGKGDRHSEGARRGGAEDRRPRLQSSWRLRAKGLVG